MREISICAGLVCTRKSRMLKFLETLYHWGRWGLKTHNHILITVFFLLISHQQAVPQPNPPTSFVVSWRWYLRWRLGPFGELLSFPACLPWIEGVYMLLNFCLFFSFYLFVFLSWGIVCKALSALSYCPSI